VSEWQNLGIVNHTQFNVSSWDVSFDWLTAAFDNFADVQDSVHELRQIAWNGVWDLDALMEFLTNAITNRLRATVCTSTVLGTQHNWKTILIVEWQWLTLLTIIVAVSQYLDNNLPRRSTC
jgi:hypothetical protein